MVCLSWSTGKVNKRKKGEVKKKRKKKDLQRVNTPNSLYFLGRHAILHYLFEFRRKIKPKSLCFLDCHAIPH